MIKKINVTCEKCKENFIFEAERSVVDKVLEEGHYICFTCQDEMDEDKMTKFEEEFKALTSWDWVNADLIQKILTKFGNWHPDEEYQELFDKYSNLNDNYEKEVIRSSKLESQIIDLKSQLQQQALPVVPECVAEWIEYVKEDGIFNALALLDKDDMPEGVNEWLFLQSNDDNINLILRAWLDGYTVEKPQLFYIDLPKVFGLSDSTFVSKAESGIISEFTKGKDYALKLTEQEIKSIDERYWQFAVPVEDGE